MNLYKIWYMGIFFAFGHFSKYPAVSGEGGCYNDGIFLPNGTIWYPEPCSQCYCHSGVQVCKSLECHLPQCQTNEDLISMPHECCPQCLPKMMPCIENGIEYKHGATWPLSPCLQCQCYNGTASCERPRCQINGCLKGQVAVQSPGECCPQCVPTGRQCKVGLEIHEDGSIWSPISCTKCQCQDGSVQCFVAQCPSLSCPLNHTLELLPGQCCPTCLGNTCAKEGIAYKSGSNWEENPCTHCSCLAGQISCFETTCPTLSCSKEEKEITYKGSCCPVCAHKKDWCTLESGTLIPHGNLIHSRSQNCNKDEHELCSCNHGKISCTSVTCQTTNCGYGKKMKMNWDETSDKSCQCPKCVPDLRLCYFDRRQRKSGESWFVGCRLCECLEGRVLCYTPTCPACNDGFSPSSSVIPFSFLSLSVSSSSTSSSSSSSSCCPECRRKTCPAECLSCYPVLGGQSFTRVIKYSALSVANNASNIISFCTACNKGFLLQDGRCVAVCGEGMYEKDARCLVCHPNCLECNGGTPFHCTRCHTSHVLREGQCVQECGKGHFSNSAICHKCHRNCHECLGPSATECLSCHKEAKLFNGTCVKECPNDYLNREGTCLKCSSKCLHCGINECLECHSGFLLQKGECQKQCQKGYFQSSDSRCLECHKTCETCNGGDIGSCTSCKAPYIKLGSLCVSSCPPLTFQHLGTCASCHESCSQCLDSTRFSCLKCSNKGEILLPNTSSMEMKNESPHLDDLREVTKPDHDTEPPFITDKRKSIGRCVTSCPDGYKLHGNLCLAPPPNCQDIIPVDSDFCLQCKNGFFKQGSKCVSECSKGYFQKDLNCIECSPHCASCFDEGSSSCQSCASWASLHQATSKSSGKNVSKCLTKCPKGHFYNPSDHSCRACHSSCEDCVIPHNGDHPLCVKCKDEKLTQVDECVVSCSANFYFSKLLKRCDKCHISCKTCSGPSPTECLSCKQRDFFTDQHSCVSKQCPEGMRLSKDGICDSKCDFSCLECQDDDSSICLSCPLGKHLLFGKCVDKCPEMFYSDLSDNGKCMECHWACSECQGPTADDCIKCGSGKLQQNGRCVAKCSEGFYEEEHSCLACPGGCTTCNNQTECYTCRGPYFLKNYQCTTHCGAGYYTNVWENKCIECEENCKHCTMFECSECEAPYLSQNGRCVEKCDTNYFPDLEKNICYYNFEKPQLYALGSLKTEYDSPTTIFNTSILHVFDMDSQKEHISFILEEIPTNGDLYIIENRDSLRKLKNKETFLYNNLEEGRIIFTYKKRKPLNGFMKLKVTDRQFESNTVMLPINIVSKYSPEVALPEPIILKRSEEIILTNNYLKFSDTDSKEAIIIKIIDGPKLGIITVDGVESKIFTIYELENLGVAYKQTNKNTSTFDFDTIYKTDSIMLQANDGYNFINFILTVMIMDPDKPSPVIVKNKGAEVTQHQKVQITKDLLQAKDLDSIDENVVYTIDAYAHSPHKAGKFVLVIPLPSTPNGFINDGWIQMDESHLSRETTSFTQKDINEGRVWYVPSPETLGFPEGSSEYEAQYRDVNGEEYPSERIVFSVSDSSNPPNILRGQSFHVKVNPSSPPETVSKMEISPGVQLGITVLEGQAVTITPSHLSFSGTDSADHLVYTITRPLGPNDGSLFHIDSPGLELRQFTQSDINEMKIIYMPPLGDIGDTEKVISFKFKISDEMRKNEGDYPEQKFAIKILPLREELNFIKPNPELIVSSFGTIEINSEYFQLTNMADTDVTVFLFEAPRHGSLTLVRKKGQDSEQFTEESEASLASILNSSMLYSNDGSKSASDSAIFLFLGKSSEATTKISFKIILEDNLEPKPHKNASFALDINEDETKIIGSKILFFTDFHSENNELVYTLSSQPKYGDLILSDVTGAMKILNHTHKLKQNDISSGLLSYSSNVEIGFEPVVDRLIFNVTDLSNNALVNQLLKIKINPIDNKAPKLKVINKLIVSEGRNATLSRNILDISDVDTPLRKLRLIVDVPPLFGYIANSDLNPKVKSNAISLLMPEFTMEELDKEEIKYVQSQHKHQEPTSDTFIIHITDEINRSPSEEIKIMIEPVNDETPVILGEQVSVERGGTTTVKNISLFISDADTDADELIISVEQAPEHGTLHKKKFTTSSFKESVSIKEGESFTFDDIIKELVFYSHDGSKVTEDQMEIIVNDGVQETGGLLEFIILPQEEKKPRILINNPLEAQRGQKTVVSPSILSATDDDSIDSQLLFVITVPPTQGTLEIYDEKGKQWRALTLGSNFLQKDISLGRIRYAHWNLKSRSLRDEIQFHIQDSEGNVLLDNALTVNIQNDENPPRINVNKGLTVNELTFNLINSNVLSATDSEIDPMEIVFKLKESPKFGHIEYVNNPHKPVKLWKQKDLELGHIGYRHTKINSLTDQFIFEASDGSNTVNETFIINITHLDEIPPYLQVKALRVQQGTRKNITRYEIQARDPDTSDEFLMFMVREAPKYGKIQVITEEGDLIETKTFTMHDISEEKLSYLHNGDSLKEDLFTITVSDPYNKGYLFLENEEPTLESSPVVVKVLSVSTGTPIIVINRGLNYLEHIDGKAQNTITSFDLNIKDEDSTPEQLVYKITQDPKHGVIRLKTHTRPVSSFTQGMVNSNQVYYELTKFDENIYNDEFIFDISDQTLNSVTGNVFMISWTWVYMSQKDYNISESDGVVQIFVKRSGNISQKSSVDCSLNSNLLKRNSKKIGKTKSDKSDTRDDKKDYVPLSLSINFGEDSREKFCEVAIVDDDVLEGKDTFSVKLTNARYSLIGKPKKSVVSITDNEDRPSLSFDSDKYNIDEDSGFIFVPVKRTGDNQVAASVYCLTKDLTAVGSSSENDADYVSKLVDQSSKIVFPPGVKLSTCDIKIIDDSKFELDESFELLLVNPSAGVTVGGITKTTITIKGPNDQSTIGFKVKQQEVVESSGKVRISVTRSGKDISHKSSVWCASKSSHIEQARPNLDFVPFSRQIVFEKGQNETKFSINIIDDKIKPRYEGPESFIVFLSTPQNASLNHDFAEINITIRDDEDIPSVQFSDSVFQVDENNTLAKIPVIRTGDLSKPSSVICFTRQRSAKGGIDFIERPNSKSSLIIFPVDVRQVNCEVQILDDLVYENKEEFILKLASESMNLAIGSNRISRIQIKDTEDKPRVTFEKLNYVIVEPSVPGELSTIKLPIIRTGDNSKLMEVNVSTLSGSAVSDVDFMSFNGILKIFPGSTREEIELKIIHNSARQWNKFFRVILGPEEPINGELGTIISTTITINAHQNSEPSILPSPPIVVSLLYYDNAAEHYQDPQSPGYPLICITPCEKQHPEFIKVKKLCKQNGFDRHSKLKYLWEVAVPEEGRGSLTPFHTLTDSTLFGNSSNKVLDSMFFARQFRVRCIVQPILTDDYVGVPLSSKPVTISSSNPICIQPVMKMGHQGQTFTAKLTYLNFTNEDNPNTIKIEVNIPHQDGMVPLLSTLPLHNVRYILTDSLYRAHHICSNLQTSSGFLSNEKDISFQQNEARPYQWDDILRGNNTLMLYRNLDLRSCSWRFVAHYTMSELIDECGGHVVSDFQVGSVGQSFLTVRVPLYLSYTYASPTPGWTSLDHRAELSVSLYYSTLLWNQGLHTEPSLTAKLQISRIHLDSSGRLIIEFSTMTKFRGQFVLNHPLKGEVESRLISPPELNLNFTLELLWSAETWDGPEQVWRATSDFTIRDYTGEYTLQLVPCTVFPSQAYEYTQPPNCVPQWPTNFTLPLSIQQIQQPVPLIYSLNTKFQLFNSLKDFLVDPRSLDNTEVVDYKGSFGPSQMIYGRVLWDPNQDLNSAYKLVIQRVFLCTGIDGYIPKFDPTGEIHNEGPQFGCIKDSDRLKHRFLLLDREIPQFFPNDSNPFEASFAKDSPELEKIRSYPGVDGFSLSTDGLYRFNSGYQWFLQVLYTIGPSQGRRYRRARTNDTSEQYIVNNTSVSDYLNATSSSEEEMSAISELGTPEFLPLPSFLQDLHQRNGTNMRSFVLTSATAQLPSKPESIVTNILYIAISVVFSVIVIIVILIIIKRYYSKRTSDKIIVVRKLTNEKEEDRRKEELRIKSIRPSGSPVTLNSESNIQAMKVKTVAVTVRNNLEENGTEV